MRRVQLLFATLVLLAIPLLGAEQNAPPAVDNPHGDFQEDCSQCHDARGWSPANIDESFDHKRFGMPLDGAHGNVPCLHCHLDLRFSTTTGTACMDCHADVHIGQMGFECGTCHDTHSFVDRGNALRSHRETQFPLRGSHATVDCAACHGPAGMRFAGYANTPTDCIECHQPEWDGTRAPNHAASGFSTDCAACHSEFAWSGETFDHALTAFPLDGAHRMASCTSCHVDGVFAGTPTSCFACHEPEYFAAGDPNHVALNFPTECASCHSTTRWGGATFGHAFPIFSGKHSQSRWVVCSKCHEDPGNPSFFNCLVCHPHSDKRKTDDQHGGRRDYSYDSMACYQCHPRGRS